MLGRSKLAVNTRPASRPSRVTILRRCGGRRLAVSASGKRGSGPPARELQVVGGEGRGPLGGRMGFRRWRTGQLVLARAIEAVARPPKRSGETLEADPARCSAGSPHR